MKDVKTMSIKEKISDFIGKWIIIILGITASLGAFTNMFDISVRMFPVIVIIVVTSGMFLAVLKTKHRRIVIITLGILMVISVIVLRKALINGIYSVANDVINVYNMYFGGRQLAFFDVKTHGRVFHALVQYNTLLICMVAMIYSYILVTATWYKMFSAIHVLLSMIFIIPGLILGKVPNSAYITILVIYYLLCFMYHRNRKIYLVRMAALVLISTSIVGLIFVFNRPAEYDAEKRYKKYSEGLNKLSEKLKLEDFSMKGIKSLFGKKETDTASGGIDGGRLGEVDKVKYSGDVMLRLEMLPDNNNLYLKGFVANEYMGNSWEDMSDHHAGIYNGFVDENPNIDLFSDGIKNNEERSNYINIMYEKDPKDYCFFPYFFDTSELKTSSLYFDLRPKLNKEKEYFYMYKSISDGEYYQYFNPYGTSETVEDLYYDISYDVPENVTEMFDGILEDPVYYNGTPAGLEACVKYVRNYLSSNTRYTLNPGKLKKGEDYVVEFLTEKKEGYCTAYASAAVLMFRYLGVPARYVEGYVISSGDMSKIRPNQNGLINVVVKDYSAHAWAEIYVPGLGFVPIEVTPGYSSSQSGGRDEKITTAKLEETSTTEKDSETNTAAPKETTTSEKKSETIGKNGKNGERNASDNGKNVYYVCGIIVFVMLLCAVSLYFYRISEKKKHLMDYKTRDLRHNIIVLSVILNECLDKLKIAYSKDIHLTEISNEINKHIDSYHKSLKDKKADGVYAEEKNMAGDNETVDHADMEEPGRRVLSAEETLQVLEIISKAKYCDENTKITTDEYDKVRQYVEEFKNSLQYLKNKV